MDLAIAGQKITVCRGGVDFVTEFSQGCFGGFQPFRRGKCDQRRFVRGGNESSFKAVGHNYFNFNEGVEASPDLAGGVFIFSEPSVDVISPRSFLTRSSPRATTPR